MTPLGMTVKVNLLTVRLIRKVLLKGKTEREEKEKKGQKKKKRTKQVFLQMRKEGELQ